MKMINLQYKTAKYSVAYHKIYRIHGVFGSDFNLVVWRFFVHSPNLNNANIVS